MAFKGTRFTCIDNSGVTSVKCIYVYGTKVVQPGSLVLVSIRRVFPRRKVLKGQMYKAVVVRCKRPIKRWSGVSLNYMRNEVVLLKKNDSVPLATRVFGSVFFELRNKGYMKIVMLSSFVV